VSEYNKPSIAQSSLGIEITKMKRLMSRFGQRGPSGSSLQESRPTASSANEINLEYFAARESLLAGRRYVQELLLCGIEI
jgi:hypothetical protein